MGLKGGGILDSKQILGLLESSLYPLPSGYDNLLPTTLWGSREKKTKSLSKATLLDLMIWGCQERHTSFQRPAGQEVAGSPSKPQRETNQMERAVVSQRRRDASPSRDCPARGQPFPFSLQQALRPHPSEILTSAPGSMATPSPGPRR